MTNTLSVVYLILAVSSADSHQIQMDSWEACTKVIDRLAADRTLGSVTQALCISRDGKIHSLHKALAETRQRR